VSNAQLDALLTETLAGENPQGRLDALVVETLIAITAPEGNVDSVMLEVLVPYPVGAVTPTGGQGRLLPSGM